MLRVIGRGVGSVVVAWKTLRGWYAWFSPRGRWTIGLAIAVVVLAIVIHHDISRRNAATTKSASVSKTNPRLPPQMTGVMFWIHHELDKVRDPEPFARKMASYGFTAGIIKVSEGTRWFQTLAARREVVKAFHRNGLRCYFYGTTWLGRSASVTAEIKYCAKAIKELGADGWFQDDVFIYPARKPKAKKLADLTRKLFEGIRAEMKQDPAAYRGKVFAFSTYPHMIINRRMPWKYPLSNCDYFVAQGYLNDSHLDPLNQLVVDEGNWQTFRAASHLGTRTCCMVPAIDGYGAVTDKDFEQLLRVCAGSYRALTVFRLGLLNKRKLELVREYAPQFLADRQLADLSIAHKMEANAGIAFPLAVSRPKKRKTATATS